MARRLSATLAAVAIAALAVTAAAPASDRQLATSLCAWNHAFTRASQTAPSLQKATNFGVFKTQVAAYARQVLAIDATLRHSFQRTSASTATGKGVRAGMLATVLPSVDRAAQRVVAGTRIGDTHKAAAAIGTGLGQLALATIQLTKIPGLFTWAPRGCFTR